MTVDGRVRCWGSNRSGKATPPEDLGPVVQLAAGDAHICALTTAGQVRCWGVNASDQLAVPPLPPGGVVEIAAGGISSCVLLAEGSVRCWGGGLGDGVPQDLQPGEVVLSVLPKGLQPGQRAAIRLANLVAEGDDFSLRVELFGDGLELDTHYRLLGPTGQPLVAETDGRYLLAGRVQPMAWIESRAENLERPLSLYILPQQLLSDSGSPPSLRLVAQRVELTDSLAPLAALRVSVPAGTDADVALYSKPTIEFSVRVEAFGAEGQRVGVAGLMLLAELVGGSAEVWQPSTDLPELLSGTVVPGVFAGVLRVMLGESDVWAALRIGVSGFDGAGEVVVDTTAVRIIRSLNFSATGSTTTEGAAGVELHIGLPLGHVGLGVEMDLRVSGTALAGLDYMLLAADSTSGIVLSTDAAGVYTLVVDAAPDGPLKLLLQPRDDDYISQEDRSAVLQISRYRADVEGGESVGLPAALEIRIFDDELPVIDRLLVVHSGVACARLNGDSVRCWGPSASPLDDLDPVAQLGVGESHSCALTVLGGVHCWGDNSDGRATPPDDLDQVVQLAVGLSHNCALTASGKVRCWGANGSGQSSPPEDLGPVAQITAGLFHSCALTVAGRVRCWGSDTEGESSPPEDLGPVVQLVGGAEHSCALTTTGRVRCWGFASAGIVPPADLGPVVQLALGAYHSCALTTADRVRCWGLNSASMVPSADLGPVVQLAAGDAHICALTAAGQVRCWGVNTSDQLAIPPLPPGGVVEIAAGGLSSCALLAEGSVRCWGGGLGDGIPQDLQPGEAVLSVLPRRLQPGQRAAIRLDDLRSTTAVLSVRLELELFGDAVPGIHYRLLNAAGQPLVAESTGRYLIGGSLPLMGYIEVLDGPADRPLFLYLQPVGLVVRRGSGPIAAAGDTACAVEHDFVRPAGIGAGRYRCRCGAVRRGRGGI